MRRLISAPFCLTICVANPLTAVGVSEVVVEVTVTS